MTSLKMQAEASVTSLETHLPLLTLDELQTESISERLPIEIWYMIIESLQPTDAMSLAISCKYFYLASGKRAASALRNDKQDMLRFLRYLDVDLPNHALCRRCAVFHRRIALETLFVWDQKTVSPFPLSRCPDFHLSNFCLCGYCDEDRPSGHCPMKELEINDRPRVKLSTELIELVFRAERLTPAHGISTDALSLTSYISPTPDVRKWLPLCALNLRKSAEGGASSKNLPVQVMFDTGAVLVRGNLIIRVRKQIELSDVHRLHSLLKLYNIGWPTCMHPNQLNFPGPEFSKALERLSEHEMKRLWEKIPANRKFNYTGPMHSCPFCASENQIEIVTKKATGIGDQTYRLVVTRWIDLGGEPDCSNQRLTAQFSGFLKRSFRGPPGSIMERFEKGLRQRSEAMGPK